MALDDRDYMQARALPLTARVSQFPWWLWIVIANLVVFFLWESPPLVATLEDHFRVSTVGIFDHARVWSPFLAAFSHRTFGHLFWTMAFLIAFSRGLDDVYAGKDLTLLYLVGACGAALGHVTLTSLIGAPQQAGLGATGSVLALGVVATLRAPRRPLSVFGVFALPMWCFLGLYLLLEPLRTVEPGRLFASGPEAAGELGTLLGGALFGGLFQLLDLRLFGRRGASVPRPSLVGRLQQRMGEASAVRRAPGGGDAAASAEPPAGRVDPTLAARVDDVLRKINREGLDSLSPAERALLDEASQRYRR